MARAPRVVVVTPNPAIDITYSLRQARLGETNRVRTVERRAGGKGLNVASVLRQLDQIDTSGQRSPSGKDTPSSGSSPRVRLAGFLGGPTGAVFASLLDTGTRTEERWTSPVGHFTTRSTVAVRTEDGTVTMFNEPGDVVSSADWQALSTEALHDVGPGDLLVVSGSCPPGTQATDLAQLLTQAREQGARCVLDTSGPLLLACAHLADVVKPNREELEQVTGSQDLLEGARRLVSGGTGAVLASDGPRGMYLITSTGSWYAPAPRVEVVNPTGAGDSAVAAVASFMVSHPEVEPIDERALCQAVALSVAAVRTPVAGLVEAETYTHLTTTVKAEKTHGTD